LHRSIKFGSLQVICGSRKCPHSYRTSISRSTAARRSAKTPINGPVYATFKNAFKAMAACSEAFCSHHVIAVPIGTDAHPEVTVTTEEEAQTPINAWRQNPDNVWSPSARVLYPPHALNKLH